ncbi:MULTISPECIES: multidrug efflux RND transporter permease subunit [unclassified Azospirillum]|uniref:multidrug efflux RND transporter permease subunit n=1 Tax=unclassified Azospirillum TaxID=2630922 RepID=UPI000B648E09|nr:MULTISPECIES: multidrug efflux RND transporter permease subunit [unclassified Azospirillum]SNS72743.1 multidrug efflux pump [Azospirillum sp. RU38E]SNS90591.1 multidrug efflux pump [Azospirillum sp. RU37A]
MSLVEPFIRRPVATTLLTIGIALAGILSYFSLPVAPLPQVDFPTISVQASMPGASPETMATSVATPLERHLGQIADVTEMTSSSSTGSTRVILQFGLDRDIDGAARDVQAAINAARADLPTSLRSNPTYRKVNPADAPVMILRMTSASMTAGQVYDQAATVLQQKLSQVKGIGQVNIGGSSLPAVRVDVNPNALFKYGIGLEQVRSALSAANANTPKGAIEQDGQRFQVLTNDQARKAEDYRDLLIAYRNGAAVKLTDVAEVTQGVEDLRNLGLANGQPAVMMVLFRQPGANIIETVDRVRDMLPELRQMIPGDIDLAVAMDRTTTIRASLKDVEHTLAIAVGLVILVVFAFLRDIRATFIPGVATVVSLCGTFGVMYLMGYSLDNLSLMALTIATGFVVDDAIVVLENVTRHVEAGMGRFQAALLGAREVAFTVISMSVSLVAVFIPILLMGGVVGRLFNEFAVTLSAAIMVSLVVSLTATPMMCAYLLSPRAAHERGQGGFFERLQGWYGHGLDRALAHPRLVLLALLGTVALNVYLFGAIPKGFFPQQDTGRIMGMVQADQTISFQAMQDKLRRFVAIVKDDPAVETVVGFTGGGQLNSANMFISLKPLAERKMSADQVIARLRGKLAPVPGASLFLQAAQDFRVGGRPGNAQYQYTLYADDLDDLRTWTPRLTEALRKSPELADVNSDQQTGGQEVALVIDRDAAARLGISMSQIDNTLYDAFGQRQVSTIYNPLNQYHVVMQLAPRFWQEPSTLDQIFIAKTAAAGQPSTMIPLSAIASHGFGTTPLAVNHQGHFAAATISFNLPPGKSLSDAVQVIDRAAADIGMPASVHGGFQGTAQAFQSSLSNQPLLILAAMVAVYVVLGMLYESYIHPITILSTLPSAGVGAVLALMAFDTEFSLIALIGVILLIGIVKKNAIMMIDFALDAQRHQGLTAKAAIRQASLLRFRPILMTTMVALLGAVPLAIGTGDGAELRQPLGIAIMGGLVISQLLTLFTTPIVYLYLDRLRGRRDDRPIPHVTAPETGA